MSKLPQKKEKFHWLRSWWSLLVATYNDWSEDRALRFSAALAYYAIFSMAPLVIIAISAAGFFFGEQAARGEIFQQIERLIGPKAAAEIQLIIQASSNKPKSALATIIGLGTLVVGASGVFAQLKDALNTIWGVRLKKGTGIKGMLKDYVLSFSIVLAIGFLLIISLLFSAGLQAVSTYMKGIIPLPSFAAPLAELTSFALLTILFALIYKVLPDVRRLDRRRLHFNLFHNRKNSDWPLSWDEQREFGLRCGWCTYSDFGLGILFHDHFSFWS